MTDRALRRLLLVCASLAGVVLALIVCFVAVEALPVVWRVGPVAFASGGWHPAEGHYDLSAMLAGTLLVAAGAVALAAPAGVLSAVFCGFYAPPRVGNAFRAVLGLLAGIPSVVYGLWGLVVLVPLVARLVPPGASLLTGILVLGLMVLPTVALASDAALQAVPVETLQGAHALGLSRWTIVRRVALPAARDGIWTGVLLQAGRALGETMAVLMVCGNVVQLPGSPFQPVRTLTANIALEMAYAMGDHRQALFTSGLLLLVLVGGLVAASRGLRGASTRGL